MNLDLSTVEDFVSRHRKDMTDRMLTRHDRYRILSQLREHLDSSLVRHESFEDNLSAIVQAASAAESYNGLKELHRRAVAEIKNYFLEEQTVVDVHDMLRCFRDAATSRVLTLVESEMEDEGYGPIPVDYCWAGLGSEGRDEHTFVTEQDNLIVFSETENDFATDRLKTACLGNHRKPEAKTKNGVGPKELVNYYFTLFSEKAAKRLDFIGFSRCSGGIMPVNEKWRRSLSNWEAQLEGTPDTSEGSLDLLDLITLADARPIKGSPHLLNEVIGKLIALLHDNGTIMKELVESAVLMPTALGFLGKFRLETAGENRGKFNIKLLGSSPLITNVRILALHKGVSETNTLKRIKILREMNSMTKELEEELTEAYVVFMKSRLLGQIPFQSEGDLSYISPEMLDVNHSSKLRKAMRSVEGFQKYVNESLRLRQAP